jgi:cell division protein FtsI (penicillin-binding protein 3)
VWTYSEPKRFLPAGDGLGLSVVGRTDIDTNGLSGLELQYDSILKGDSGKLIVEQGKGGRTIPGGEQEVSPARAGDDLVLSIDRGLQFEAEELLKRAVDANGAKGGTVLVSKTNGEILVDANVVRDEGGTARTVAENRAVTWTYEPGSIEKAITMAGVLEEGLATPDTIRFISSNLVVAGRLFEQEHRSVDADLSLTDILKNSDNVGTMTWAQDLGKDKLDKYVRKFGLGSPTGLEFPGESRGKVADVDKWNALSLPTIAIGQGLSVTPMQMLSAYNTIANGGMHVEPRFVLGQESPAGVFTAAKAADPSRVVSPATATALTQMLTKVVTEGTGTKAQVAGYTVAGKTGTAWEPLDGGGYTDIYNHHKLVTSFVGFLPAANPELTILVVLDQPSDPGATGGTVAAPLFRDVASYAVRHLRLPPDAEAAPPGPRDRVRATPQAAPTTTSTTTTTTPSRKGSPVASTKSKAR